MLGCTSRGLAWPGGRRPALRPPAAPAGIARARCRGSQPHGHRPGSSGGGGSGGSGGGSWQGGSGSWQQLPRRPPGGEPAGGGGTSSGGGGPAPAGEGSSYGAGGYASTSGSGGSGGGGGAAGSYGDERSGSAAGGYSGAKASAAGAGASPSQPSFLQALPSFSRQSPAGARTPLGEVIMSRLRAARRSLDGSLDDDSGGESARRWSFTPPPHADGSPVSLVALVVLAPVAVWALTWGLTAGLASVADSCMGGMVGLARALYPHLPVRGVTHEDVAVSLVKSIQAGTVDDAAWTRQGLWLPAWFLQWSMRLLFGLAAGSTSIAASLAQVGPWMAAGAISQALLYGLCLLVALPVGAGLHAAMARIEAALGGSGDGGSTPPSAAPAPASSSTALTIKLAGTLAWPCISAAAVGGAIAARASLAPPFALALPCVCAAVASVALLLTVALATARYAREVGLGAAGDAAAVDFGLQVGVLCGAGAALNAVWLLLGAAAGAVGPREALLGALSTAVLARIAATVWALRSEAQPSVWLQLLTLDTLFARGGGKPKPA